MAREPSMVMAHSNLFKPLKLGGNILQNRVALAPLTRYRADDNHVPLPFVAKYYEQRASSPGTLLITEATFIAPQAGGYRNVPGIWSEDQIQAWKKVVEAVHEKKSFIFLQLWALGRASKISQLQEELGPGAKVVSASDIPFKGGEKPTPLTEEEIVEYIDLYRQAAKNAIAAGFDGVEVHCANGYLIDQFLQDVSNQRTDRWGGSIERRARFGLEVTKAVIGAVGAERTGLRISPFGVFQGMKMQDPKPQFTYFVEELKKLDLTYLHIIESISDRASGMASFDKNCKVQFLVDLWNNQSPVLIAGGFDPDSAYKAVDEEYKDKDVCIALGRHFVSNPDIVFRIKNGIALAPYDKTKFYNAKQESGYVDYPFCEEFERQKLKL